MATKTTTKKKTSSIVGKNNMTDRISGSVDRKYSLNKNQIGAVLTQYLEETKKALIKGERIRFPGYFSFWTATQAARMAMNLQTKKKMSIPAKRVPKAKFSDDLKMMIKKSRK